jgi:uncharacterized membrane protein YciS (DUF1049 family)
MTFEITLGLIALGFAIVMFGFFFLSICFSAKKAERDLKENLKHMAKIDEVFKEKVKREGYGNRLENLEDFNMSDLWNC